MKKLTQARLMLGDKRSNRDITVRQEYKLAIIRGDKEVGEVTNEQMYADWAGRMADAMLFEDLQAIEENNADTKVSSE